MDPRLTQPSLSAPWRPPNPPPLAKPPPSKPKPLAEVVAAHREAVDSLARLDLADAKGQRELWAANDRLEAAQGALEKALSRGATASYARLTGARTPSGPTIPKAEQVVAEVEAEIADLIAARQRIAREREQVEFRLVSYRGDLTRAVAETVADSPEMADLAAAYQAALGQLRAIQAAFQALPLGALPPSVAGWQNTNFGERVGVDETLADTWRAAIAALETDPDAPLPKIRASRDGSLSAKGGPAGGDHRQKQHRQQADARFS